MPHPVHPGHEASEPPETIETREKEREKERDQESEEQREQREEAIREVGTQLVLRTSKEKAQEAMKESDKIIGNVASAANEAMAEDQLDSTYDHIEMRDIGVTSAISGLRRDFEDYRAEKLLGEARAGRSAAKYFIAAAILGLIVSIPTIVDIKRHWDDNEKEEEDEGRKLILERIKQWRLLSDKTLWSHIAELTDTERPAIQELMIWVASVKEICEPLERPWVWRNDDAADYVDYVLNIYNKNTKPKDGASKASVIFRTLPTLDYNYPLEDSGARPLPRQVAADIAELTLFRITQQNHT